MPILIREEIAQLSTYDLGGELDTIIERLQELKKSNKDKNLKAETKKNNYDDGEYISVYYDREENEKEKQKRLKQEEENKIWRKRQYESLKKEFEKS